jgi:hypothetical protein
VGAAYAGGLNRGVNITNANVTALYRNARVSNGISGMAAGDFTAGRFAGVQRVSSAARCSRRARSMGGCR